MQELKDGREDRATAAECKKEEEMQHLTQLQLLSGSGEPSLSL